MTVVQSPINGYLPEVKPQNPEAAMGCSNRSRQITIFVLLAMSATSSSDYISLYFPIYPQLAEEKGSSDSVFGFVLGSSSIIMFLVTPIIGKHVKSIGLKFAFTSGMLVTGVCSILSGFIHRLNPDIYFLAISMAIHIVRALGNAAVVTSSFAIMGIEFPKSVAKVFGFTRLSMQVGYLLGPILGGTLFQLGGFSLPFFLVGGFNCIVALLALLLHPGYRAFETRSDNPAPVRILSILRIPGSWIAFSTFVIFTFTSGFLMMVIKPHIAQRFSLQPHTVSVLFTIKQLIGGLCALAWGYFADKTKSIKPFLVLCSLIAGISILIVNQYSEDTYDPVLYIIIAGIFLNEIGTCGEQVFGLMELMRQTFEAGHPNDPDVHGCLAGLWSSFCGLGRFLSRSISGILVDQYGHSSATMIISGLNLLLAIVILVLMLVKSNCCGSKPRGRPEERRPLVSSGHHLPNYTYSMV